jgi:hypothetical protein
MYKNEALPGSKKVTGREPTRSNSWLREKVLNVDASKGSARADYLFIMAQ